MNYLITAGPTREYIDDVRYLSNASSGRMGCALVEAARRAGARVTLVCGPMEVERPRCEAVVPVTSAEEMRRAVLARDARADVVVMAAAVADYRPARRLRGKMKKRPRGLRLALVPTRDILAELGRRKRPGQVLVGFALEANDARANARRKLREKDLDLIVVNSPAAMGAMEARVEIIRRDGRVCRTVKGPKTAVARAVVAAIEEVRRAT